MPRRLPANEYIEGVLKVSLRFPELLAGDKVSVRLFYNIDIQTIDGNEGSKIIGKEINKTDFPKLFKEMAMQCDGAYLKNQSFVFINANNLITDGSIGAFYCFSEKDSIEFLDNFYFTPEGFPEDVIEIIGEPYIKSKSKTIHNKSGLGLGSFLGKTLLEIVLLLLVLQLHIHCYLSRLPHARPLFPERFQMEYLCLSILKQTLQWFCLLK